MSVFNRVDRNLKIWYEKCSKFDYWDGDRGGKFKKWIIKNNYDAERLNKELNMNPHDCPIVYFDKDFPLKNKNKKKSYDRILEIFCVIKYCYIAWQAYSDGADHLSLLQSYKSDLMIRSSIVWAYSYQVFDDDDDDNNSNDQEIEISDNIFVLIQLMIYSTCAPNICMYDHGLRMNIISIIVEKESLSTKLKKKYQTPNITFKDIEWIKKSLNENKTKVESMYNYYKDTCSQKIKIIKKSASESGKSSHKSISMELKCGNSAILNKRQYLLVKSGLISYLLFTFLFHLQGGSKVFDIFDKNKYKDLMADIRWAMLKGTKPELIVDAFLYYVQATGDINLKEWNFESQKEDVKFADIYDVFESVLLPFLECFAIINIYFIQIHWNKNMLTPIDLFVILNRITSSHLGGSWANAIKQHEKMQSNDQNVFVYILIDFVSRYIRGSIRKCDKEWKDILLKQTLKIWEDKDRNIDKKRFEKNFKWDILMTMWQPQYTDFSLIIDKLKNNEVEYEEEEQ